MNLPDEFGLVAKYRPISVMLIGLVAAAFAWAIVFLGYLSDVGADWSEPQKSFAHNPKFLLWLLLILAQAALWPIVVLAVIHRIREIKAYAPGDWGEVVLSVLLFMAAAISVGLVAVLEPDLPNWLPGYDWKLSILSVIALSAALMPAIGIWKAQGALRQVLEQVGAAKPRKVHLDRLLHLKETLNLCLVLLGSLLSLAVIAAAAERQAVEAFGKLQNPSYKVDSDFPADYVTLYGLLLSVLVGLVYMPAHVTLRAVGVRFRDKLVPMVEPSDMDAWSKRLGERRAFEDLLNLQAGAGANLKAGIVALTPLLATLTSLIGD